MKRYIIILLSLLLLIMDSPTYAMESKSVSNIKGIDVSHWSGTIDWSKVASSGVKFAYLKATEGASNVDQQFAIYLRGAKAESIAVGAYHYAKPTSPYNPAEPVNQAILFVKTMKASLTDYGDIMPVLDLEEDGGLSPNDLAKWARTFVETVEQSTHRQVMLYTSEDFLQNNGQLNYSLSDLPLWIAYWDQYYAGQNPPDMAGWHQWTVWQYSNQGSLSGINGTVDVNVGPTSLDTLRGDLSTSITLQLGSDLAKIDGKPKQLDAVPFTVENRTMVPIRFISETLGAKVEWNPVTEEVKIAKGNASISLKIGEKAAAVNGSHVDLDVSAQLVNNRTFVSLRFISETLGQQVQYHTNGEITLLSN